MADTSPENDIDVVLEPTETEIEVEVASAVEEKSEETAVSAPAVPLITPDEGIQELKHKLEQERLARQAAEQRARLAAEQVTQARNGEADSNMRVFSTAVETTQGNIAQLKKNLRDSYAAGDFDAVADLTVKISHEQVNLDKLTTGKYQYEESLKRQKTSNPVEAFASQLTAPSADWVRRHPDVVTNPVLHRKMIRAHEDALDEGIVPDTPEYFSYVEGRVNSGANKAAVISQNEVPVAQTPTAPEPRRAAAPPPAAPSSRAASTSPGKQTVRLSAAERQMAGYMNMSNEQYAKHKMELMRQGRIGKG